MTHKELLSVPGIVDVILTVDTLFIIYTKKPPKIYSDLKIVEIPLHRLYLSSHLGELIGGVSLRYGPLGELNGLIQAVLYEYSLKHLKIPDKQAVSHLLNGTGGRKSIIDRVRGRKVGRSALMVPTEAQKDIEQFFKEHSCKWKKRVIYLKGDIK